MQTLGCPILYLEDGKATFYQNFQKLHDRDTSKQPEPAKQEDKPQKAGYGKEQRRRRAEVRTRLKALETEIEELGAHIVELENEINDPEVLRDHLLLRDKCDELDDSRFHQQELYDEWEKLAEEQDRMMQKVIPEKRVERCTWHTGPRPFLRQIRLQKMRNIKNSNGTVTCFPDKKRYTIFDIGLVRLGRCAASSTASYFACVPVLCRLE